MARFQDRGLVVAVRETPAVRSWQLTELGVKQHTVVQSLASPTALFAVRDVPLPDRTRWELATTVVEKGWTLYPGAGRLPPLDLGSDRRVFAMLNAAHSYRLALCHSDELLAVRK